MRYKIIVFIICLTLINTKYSFAQCNGNKVEVPPEIAQKSFEHILNITAYGVHSAGSFEEMQVSNYIFEELTEHGIETHIEDFEFESFDIIETKLEINHHKVEAIQVCFNPYINNFKFQDDFVLLDSDNTTSINIGDKIVIASFPLDNSKYFNLFFGGPKLILVISKEEFEMISLENSRQLTCTIKGEIKKHHSQNVVGIIHGKQNTNDELIISAHYDSYPGSVGADDNASGVGILIELAKLFNKNKECLTKNLKFVAFGGEEKGLLGSRAFLNRHVEDISNCSLLINIDQVGGEHIFIETNGGVHGIPDTIGKTQFPEFMRNRSLEGIESNWRLLAPEALPIFAISNRPEWLADIIKESVTELSISATFTGNTGSDQMSFAQAGIVATAIGTSGNEVHSPKDIPSQVKTQSLFNCANLISSIILKTNQIK